MPSLGLRLRDAEDEADDDREVPRDRGEGGDGEVVVRVEDPDEDPGDAEERDDREEDAGEVDRELVAVAEQLHHERRREDEGRGQRRQAEQEEPEDARRDAPGAGALSLLEQLAEDGNEGGGERGIGDERADEVGNLERDRERVDPLALDAEDAARDDLADESEDPGESGGGGEDGRRPGEPLSLGSLVHGASIGIGSATIAARPPSRGPFFDMANIKQQKKRVRITERQREENLRYRSTVKTLTKRLEAAVAGHRQGASSPPSTSSSSGRSTRPPRAEPCTRTRLHARRRGPPASSPAS